MVKAACPALGSRTLLGFPSESLEKILFEHVVMA